MTNKKIKKRKFDNNISYKQMLESYSIVDLKSIGSAWELKGLSKFKKSELLEYIHDYIVNNLHTKFEMFNFDHLSIMSELIKGNNILGSFPEASEELMSLGIILEGLFSDSISVVIHKSVFDSFVAYYTKNQDKLAFNTFLKDYMDLATNLYGVLTVDEFVDMVFEFNDGSINKEYIKEISLLTAKHTTNSNISNDYLYYYRLNEYIKVYNDITTREDLFYYKINHELLSEFVKNKSELWTSAHSKLLIELENNYNGDRRMTLDIIDELRLMLSYNHGVSDFISVFAKRNQVENMMSIKSFADVIISINNEINQWQLKGSSPNMLSKYKKQEPIIKGDKIGRNDICPCGSGKKYKKCCINKDS